MRPVTKALALFGALAAFTLAACAQDRPGAREPDPRGPVHPIVAALDANRDGVIDADEIKAAPVALARLDQDGDGKLSRAEFAGPRPDPASGERPGRLPGGRDGGAAIQNEPRAKDAGEQRILDTLAEMRRSERHANVSAYDGRVLRQFAEVMNAQTVVEIGTSTGESAVWLALGLRRTGGKLFTHEIDAERAKIARANFQKAGVDHLITLVEGDAHETVQRYREPIDILFLDADKRGYVDYLRKLLPLVRPGGLVVAHNMRFPPPDPRYLEAITTDPKLETSFLLMEGAGLGVTLKKR